MAEVKGMNAFIQRFAIGSAALAIPFVTMAAEADSSRISWYDSLKIAFAPILIFGFVAGVFWLLFRNMKKNPAMKRYEGHMDRVETLLTRIADNVEKKLKDEDKN